MNRIHLSQSGRPLGITTPLGTDVLGLRSIQVREQLSGGFTIEAELSSADPAIKFDDIVGHPVTVWLNRPDKTKRFWHGYVARFYLTGQSDQFFHYRAVIVHWLWALTRSADCRIFQNTAAPDIVQQVFRDCGEKDFSVRLSGSYPTLEYCVQYRETHFNFVSRLLEQEGIAYYYTHDASTGTLVLADEKAAYDPAPGYGSIRHVAGAGAHQQEVITTWHVGHEVQPTQYALTDYNPLKPKETMLRVERTGRDYGLNDREVFDYPGGFAAAADSERLSRIRLDELQAATEVARAKTTCLGLCVGHLFTLADHPRSEQNREYLITTLNLNYDAGEFTSDGKFATTFSCEFTAIPSSYAFRPPRVTPKPFVHGPQPAVVVGPSGEEIHTDDHGRIKVHFFWDRYGKYDEKASCWVRVAQSWAGKRWGALFLPRIGHEVLVDFLEGDPDRPLVTGCVYNADNVPPYPLPAQKNISTLKSDSTKGGGGFNEIKLDDTKGKELLYVQAEKDRTVLVKNDNAETIGHDETVHVGNDRKKSVDQNETTTIGANRTESVGKDEKIDIGQNRTETVAKNEDITIGENRTEKVVKDEAITIDGNRTEKVGKDETITIDANRTESVAKNEQVKVGGDRTVNVGKNDALTVAKKLTIDAGDEITIKTGSASISMKKDGTIQIKGKDITIEGSGGINVKASKNVVLKGQKILQN